MMSSGNSSENQIRHLGGVGPSAKEKKEDRYLMHEISAEFAKNVFAQTQNETFIQNHVNY